jgi:hypothetical protein
MWDQGDSTSIPVFRRPDGVRIHDDLRQYARLLRYAGVVNDEKSAAEPGNAKGLCADCVHARGIESDRKSTFILCELSFTDSRFTKYPRLPIISCEGFKKKL